MTERQSVVAYLKTQKIHNPADEAEEHMNQVLDHLITQIERGAHRAVEGKYRR
jgi:hypothetical protein